MTLTASSGVKVFYRDRLKGFRIGVQKIIDDMQGGVTDEEIEKRVKQGYYRTEQCTLCHASARASTCPFRTKPTDELVKFQRNGGDIYRKG